VVLSGQHAHDRLPALLQRPHALAELLVLAFARVRCDHLDGLRPRVLAQFFFEAPVLVLELGDALGEGRELDLAPVARVLRGDPVPVCAGLAALLGGDVRAGALAGGPCGGAGCGLVVIVVVGGVGGGRGASLIWGH
jgi:hypothetical protein